MADIVDAYNSLFTGYGDMTYEVSGTSLPNFFWQWTGEGENSKPVAPDVIHNLGSQSEFIDEKGNGKNTIRQDDAIYDIRGNNVKAPWSLFNDYKLFHYSGIMGMMYPNDPNYDTKFNDDKMARSNVMWANVEPTYKNIITAYSEIEAAAYKIQDFIYNKYYNRIPPNYLITLRRYPNACTDIPFTLGWNEDVHSELYPTSPQLPISTATTYISELAGNKMDDLLKFTFGTNWTEIESEIQEIQNGNPGATAFGVGKRLFDAAHGDSRGGLLHHFKQGAAAFGTNVFTGKPLTYAQQTTAEYYANIDPWQKFGKFTQGPVDVVMKTKRRDKGLEFANDYSLKFDYELKSLQYINPKIAMLDIISNMVLMGTNSGTWWGGATRYYGNGGGYGRQIGDVNLFAKGDYAGYFKSVANSVTQKVTRLSGGTLPSSIGDVIKLALQIAKGGLNNMLGSLINGNLGQIGGTTPANALIEGDPTGYWHVTMGNPLNPIAMMGNMICKQIEMTMGDGLGYDDFPVSVSFVCSMEHGKPRDAGDIESMFNAGKGRIYQAPYLGNIDGATQADKERMERAKEASNSQRPDAMGIGRNVGLKTNAKKLRTSTNKTQFPLFDKTIDQVVAYTR